VLSPPLQGKVVARFYGMFKAMTTTDSDKKVEVCALVFGRLWKMDDEEGEIADLSEQDK
jgi:hypothetical protein